MKGAIIGDIVGSVYEFNNILTKDFPMFSKASSFTDDTVMTCAVAQALIESKGNADVLPELTVKCMHEIGRRYPDCGYGARFYGWMFDNNAKPYNSFGNGSAMRISAVGLYADSFAEAKKLARAVTAVTHNHPEGIKGAEAIACAMVCAKNGYDKPMIKKFIEQNFRYNLNTTLEEYRKQWDGHGAEICQVSVPQALVCFLEGNDYEDVIRNCVSIGGDSDTLGAIAGAVAECFYGVPEKFQNKMYEYLPADLAEIVDNFYDTVG